MNVIGKFRRTRKEAVVTFFKDEFILRNRKLVDFRFLILLCKIYVSVTPCWSCKIFDKEEIPCLGL